MTKKIAEGKTLGLKYEIYDNTGIVEQIEFSKDMLITLVHQKNMVNLPNFVGGVPQAGYHQQIRLAGNSNAINVDGPKVADHNGDQLTLFLLTRSHNKNGIYFGSVNHSTRKTTDNPGRIRDQLFPWFSFWVVLALSLVAAFAFQMIHMDRSVLNSLVATGIIFPALYLPCYVAGWWIGLVRTIAVRQNREFRAYADSIRQQLGKTPTMA